MTMSFFQRAFTVGIGGPVGSGKTATVLALCKYLRDTHNICVVTNDIFTRYLKIKCSAFIFLF